MGRTASVAARHEAVRSEVTRPPNLHLMVTPHPAVHPAVHPIRVHPTWAHPIWVCPRSVCLTRWGWPARAQQRRSRRRSSCRSPSRRSCAATPRPARSAASPDWAPSPSQPSRPCSTMPSWPWSSPTASTSCRWRIGGDDRRRIRPRRCSGPMGPAPRWGAPTRRSSSGTTTPPPGPKPTSRVLMTSWGGAATATTSRPPARVRPPPHRCPHSDPTTPTTPATSRDAGTARRSPGPLTTPTRRRLTNTGHRQPQGTVTSGTSILDNRIRTPRPRRPPGLGAGLGSACRERELDGGFDRDRPGEQVALGQVAVEGA